MTAKAAPKRCVADCVWSAPFGLLEAAAGRGLLDFAVIIQRLRQTNARLDEEVIRAALTRNPLR